MIETIQKQKLFRAVNTRTKLTGIAQPYDNNGNLTQSGTNTYSWDYKNRLTQSGNGTAGIMKEAPGVRGALPSTFSQSLYKGAHAVREMTGQAISTAIQSISQQAQSIAVQVGQLVSQTALKKP